MKKPLSFKDKVRIIIYWLKQHQGMGLITTCGICKSTRIKRLDSSTTPIDDGVSVYKGYYTCQNCNAVGRNDEIWSKGD